MAQSDIKIIMMNEDSEEKFAKICAALVMQGVVFHAYEHSGYYYIEFTGGF